jgi:rhodanese-related sulfurtransferase
MNKTEDPSEVPEVSPLEAHEMLKADKDAVLLDVRSKMEFDYVGHPIGALNIPWQNPPKWQLNPEFLDNVRDALTSQVIGKPPENRLILAMCRSGKRSLDAATYLQESGFENVINIREGFEGGLDSNRHRGNLGGWRYHKLPWEQT